jgi:5-methylcytosine-specific restriction protein A
MPIRDVLQKVLSEYLIAKSAVFEAHPLAAYLRHSGADPVGKALGESGAGLSVEGSPGQGNWAAVPWISLFDPAVTQKATTGYYLVYLFHATKPLVYLSLNQGTTAVRQEFAMRTRQILKDRADLIRKRVPEFVEFLPVTQIDLGSTDRLPGDYVAGHALGVSYELATLPNEEKLHLDLVTAVRAYRALTYRGGIDAEPEAQADVTREFALTPTSIFEMRKYAFHRKIERSSVAGKAAKTFHGIRCQACDLSFNERYGEIGKGFIEAHHLRPISTLEEGIAVSYEVATDFAVLCSNCHRMIHRFSDPSDVAEFRKLISKAK